MAIQNTTLTTSYSSVYTSTGDSATTVIYICNTSAPASLPLSNTIKFDLCVVPSGGTPGASNQIYTQVEVAAQDTYIIELEKLILEDGDSLQAKDDTGSVTTVTVSYVSI